MKISIKYYGKIEDITHCDSEDLVIPSDSTVEDVDNILRNKYYKLETISYKIAAGSSFQLKSKQIKEGEELALLPPFAGG